MMSLPAAILAGCLSGILVSLLVAWLPFRQMQGGEAPVKDSVNVHPRLTWKLTLLLTAIMSLASVLLYLVPIGKLNYLYKLIFIAYLLPVSLVDIRHHRVPWSFSIIGIALGILLGTRHAGWVMTLIGGVTNFAIYLVVYALGKKMPAFASRAGDGVPIGFGDVVFSGILGLALGFPNSYWGLLLGAGIGALFVFVIWLVGKVKGSGKRTMAYVPALAAGALIMFLLF
jgi:leader peptidase (prepilin peptidase)/N-methyltransferase